MRVTSVPSGHELGLADGRLCRLAGLIAPKSVAEEGFALLRREDVPKGWPGEALKQLGGLALDAEAELFLQTPPEDRHGRMLAQAVVNGVWLQGAMIAQGLGRVYPLAGADEEVLAALFSAERAARAARRGIWRDPMFALVQPGADLTRRANVEEWPALGGYVLVEGVADVAQGVGGRPGLDRSTRSPVFTLSSASGATVDVRVALGQLKKEAGCGAFRLPQPGDLVRVRGKITSAPNAEINVAHCAQIAILAQR